MFGCVNLANADGRAFDTQTMHGKKRLGCGNRTAETVGEVIGAFTEFFERLSCSEPFIKRQACTDIRYIIVGQKCGQMQVNFRESLKRRVKGRLFTTAKRIHCAL